MRRFAPLVCLAVIAACPLPAQAQGPAPELVVERPSGKPLIKEGQPNRRLLGGTWYFRLDDTFAGESERWFAQRDLEGWTAISVPHNWNGTDVQFNRSSVGWYRKEFTVPRSPRRSNQLWKLRFEGANYRTKLWLNGKRIGGVQTGYFPFEVDLAKLRRGRNTLVAEVSSLRSNSDLTHWRPAAFNGFGTGGWWNFGGLLREVYARRADTIDIEDVNLLPRLRRLRGPARVEVRTLVRNLTRRDRNVQLEFLVDGERIRPKPQGVAGKGRRLVVSRFTLKRPKLWQPGRPRLYNLRVRAFLEGAANRRALATYRLAFGVRKLETRPGGVIRMNGKRLNLRGASIHEDDAQEGGALSSSTRRRLLNRLKGLGATVTRSHYPLHPAFIESLDRAGIMYWVQAPVYQVPTSNWERAGVRALAQRAVERTVRNNVNHPSIFTWSIANEPSETGSDLGNYSPTFVGWVRDASFAVRELDDTRFVAIDRQSRIGEPYTTDAHQYLDVLGVNEYFGWYRSVAENLPDRPNTTTEELSPYLDELHAANSDLPLVITEFGAEASTWGPVEQKGTYEFQRRWVVDHLRIHASKPYVNGSIHWALRDFRVHPAWSGGAPAGWTTPPWHNKSLIEETNRRKPAFLAVARLFRRAKPLR